MERGYQCWTLPRSDKNKHAGAAPEIVCGLNLWATRHSYAYTLNRLQTLTPPTAYGTGSFGHRRPQDPGSQPEPGAPEFVTADKRGPPARKPPISICLPRENLKPPASEKAPHAAPTCCERRARLERRNEEHRLKPMPQKGAAKGAGIKASATKGEERPALESGPYRSEKGGLRKPPLQNGMGSETAAEGALGSARSV